jgi:hypothetical protein
MTAKAFLAGLSVAKERTHADLKTILSCWQNSTLLQNCAKRCAKLGNISPEWRQAMAAQ